MKYFISIYWVALFVQFIDKSTATKHEDSTDFIKLNYQNEQLCHITDSEKWSSIKKQALSLNQSTCRKSDQATGCRFDQHYLGDHMCEYAEFCAFADENFSCGSDKYNCSLVTDGMLNCTKDGITDFRIDCKSSLLYCPCEKSSHLIHLEVGECSTDRTPLMDAFTKECIPVYENNTGHRLWFYVDIDHFNGNSNQKGILKSIHHPDWAGDITRECGYELKVPVEWIAALTIVGLVLLVAFIYGMCQVKRVWKNRRAKLISSVENYVENYFRHLPTNSSNETAAQEKVEYISVSSYQEDTQCTDVESHDDEIHDNAGPDFVPLATHFGYTRGDTAMVNPAYMIKCSTGAPKIAVVPDEDFFKPKVSDHSYERKDDSGCASMYDPYMPKNI